MKSPLENLDTLILGKVQTGAGDSGTAAGELKSLYVTAKEVRQLLRRGEDGAGIPHGTFTGNLQTVGGLFGLSPEDIQALVVIAAPDIDPIRAPRLFACSYGRLYHCSPS